MNLEQALASVPAGYQATTIDIDEDGTVTRILIEPQPVTRAEAPIEFWSAEIADLVEQLAAAPSLATAIDGLLRFTASGPTGPRVDGLVRDAIMRRVNEFVDQRARRVNCDRVLVNVRADGSEYVVGYMLGGVRFTLDGDAWAGPFASLAAGPFASLAGGLVTEGAPVTVRSVPVGVPGGPSH